MLNHYCLLSVNLWFLVWHRQCGIFYLFVFSFSFFSCIRKFKHHWRWCCLKSWKLLIHWTWCREVVEGSIWIDKPSSLSHFESLQWVWKWPVRSMKGADAAMEVGWKDEKNKPHKHGISTWEGNGVWGKEQKTLLILHFMY